MLYIILLCRWDVLTEILEAQKQRISRLSVQQDIGAAADSQELLGKSFRIPQFHDRTTARRSGPFQRCITSICFVLISAKQNHKKRKITGSKRIQFETTYAKVSSKLDAIGM